MIDKKKVLKEAIVAIAIANEYSPDSWAWLNAMQKVEGRLMKIKDVGGLSEMEVDVLFLAWEELKDYKMAIDWDGESVSRKV